MRCFIPLLIGMFGLFAEAVAQNGQPFVTDIPFDRSLGEVRVTAMMQRDDRSMLLCTSRGILVFDGTMWELVPTPAPPLTLVKAADGNIYLGMRKGASRLMVSDSGTYHLTPLLPDSMTDPVHQILTTDEHVFLINDMRMVSVGVESGKVEDVFEFGEKLFSGAFLLFDIPHLLFYQEGLFSYQDKELTRIGQLKRLAENQLVFDLNTKRGIFLCFENGDLYLFDGIRMGRVDGKLPQYLSDNRPSDGLVLNDSLIAFSTLSGGAVVADLRNNSIIHKLDYSTGLPDNEITALGRDDNDGLWMAYGSGVSRLDLRHPISRYHNYPGLRGIIASTAMHNDELYVGTGNGVFVLTESRDRAEVQRMLAEKAESRNADMPSAPEPKSKASENKEDSKPKQQEVNEEEQLIARYLEDPSEVKKELSRKELRELRKTIRKKKKAGELDDEDAADDEEEEPEEEEPMVVEELPKPSDGKTTEKKTTEKKSAIKSGAKASSSQQTQGTYVYRNVRGLDVKCRQLAVIGNVLYAATPNGLFKIDGTTSTNLTPGIYVNHVSATRDGNTLLLATRSGVQLLKQKGGRWNQSAANDSIRANMYNVIEDAEGNLWAGSDNMVTRFKPTDNGYITTEYFLESGHLERVLVAELSGMLHLLVPSGILRMTEDGPAKATIHGLEGGHYRLDFFLGDEGQVWVNADGTWSLLSGEGNETLLNYLPIFEDIRHLSTDSKGRLFLVDKGNEVYSISPGQDEGESVPFSVFIRKALAAEDRSPFSMGEMTVSPGENSLIFHLSAPFYLKSMATEYQYRVEGLRDSWSRWGNDPDIEIPFLPPGSYVLHVRARNVLGEISEVRSLPFTVMKPIWQRWYAILFYIIVVVGIVYLIIKAREKSLRETQRELEEKVQQRTADLALEKERAEKLLLNILPKETADELQERGKATARHYNQVSVLFTDFKGFTRFAESTRPEDLVNELDRCFIAFDDIIERYRLEKIKTIGDAYMCAGGVPTKTANNAVAIVLAGLSIRDFMNDLQVEKKGKNERFWEIRIGIHTGPLTAGVVGKKKFAYDIWGDTVNTASRMESCSEPGMINISASTHELVKTYFDCTYRGKLNAKGKGEVDMYFVNGIRPEFSENGDGVTPNKALMETIG